MKKLLFIAAIFLVSCNAKQETAKAPVTYSPMFADTLMRTASLAVPVVPQKMYNPKILPHLVTLAGKLKAGEINSYDWNNNTSCNVGLMAQCITGMNAKEISASIDSFKDYDKYADEMTKIDESFLFGSWSNMTNFYCGITNRTGVGIIKDLQDAGFTAGNIQSLEYLSDSYILSKTAIEVKSRHYADKNNLIAYLDAWIEIIASQEENSVNHNNS